MKSLIHTFDLTVTRYILTLPEGLYPFMYWVSILGQPIITVGIGLIIAIFGLIQSNWRLALSGGVAMGALAFNTLIKVSLQRDRPMSEYVEAMRFDTFSFPSGHTLGSTVAFGLLAYLAYHYLPQPWGTVALIGLILLIIVIGISRIYLQAHFPSDVVGAWILGAIFLFIIIFVIKPTL